MPQGQSRSKSTTARYLTDSERAELLVLSLMLVEQRSEVPPFRQPLALEATLHLTLGLRSPF